MVYFLLLAAAVIFWIVFSDRMSRMEFRIKQLEQKLNASGAQPNAQEAAPVPPAPQPDPILAPSPNVSTPSPVAAAAVSPVKPEQPAVPSKPLVDWQNFTAAKLFSWVGGFTLFLGVVFWIKYSIENNLISPTLRVVLGALLGLLLVGAGLWIRREDLKITAGTLCGSGVAALYVSIYAAHAFYHLLGAGVTFTLLALTSLGAFALAVYKNAQYIGILGAIIAFLTPFLLRSGQDQYGFFFSYILLINAAAIAAAWRKGWNGLTVCVFSFTWLCQLVWLSNPAPYKAYAFMTLFALYSLGAAWLSAQTCGKIGPLGRKAADWFLTLQLVLCALLLWSRTGTDARVIIGTLGLALLVNLALAFLTDRDPAAHQHPWRAGKTAALLLLVVWIFNSFTPEHLWLTLGFCLAFTAVNLGAEFRLSGKHPSYSIDWLGLAFPLALMVPFICKHALITAYGMGPVTFLFLGLLAAAVLLALKTKHTAFASLSGAMTVLLLILCALHARFSPSSAHSVLWFMFMALLPSVVIFAAFHFGKKQWGELPAAKAARPLFIAALSPYVLMVTLILNTPPAALPASWLFGAALLTAALTGFFVHRYQIGFPMMAALGGVTLVQMVYYVGYIAGADAPSLVPAFAAWTLGSFIFFNLYVFVFHKRLMDVCQPWAAGAFSGAASCVLLYLAFKEVYTLQYPGLLPLAFALAYVGLINVVYTYRPMTDPVQTRRMAVYCGTALFFVSLIFPLQYSNQWLTLAWGLEGAALVWLYRRIAYKGLLAAAFILLSITFVRILLNPAFYLYPAPVAPVWNHYLPVYGLCAAAFLLAARWWPKEGSARWANMLNAMGGVSLFVLLNIEIASYFSAGGRLTFAPFDAQSLAAGVTYTLAWALFGGGCVALGLYKRLKALAVPGLVLIALSTLKLFAVDIWGFGTLYRIFALFGLAVILLGVSLGYQRFKNRF